jgi:hypothetical protein
MEPKALDPLSADEKIVAHISHAAALGSQCEAERKLLAAVLKDALLIYKNRLSVGGARFKEVERWIFGKDTDRLFAFETVCAILGLSTQRIRTDLLSFAAVKLSYALGHPTPSSSRH